MNRTFIGYLRYLSARGHKKAANIMAYAKRGNPTAGGYRKHIQTEIKKGGVSADYGAALINALDEIEAEYHATGHMLGEPDGSIYRHLGDGGYQRNNFLCK